MELNAESVVVITGASSGIGAALARTCASYGVRLALCARRERMLSSVAEQARQAGAAQVLEVVCDVSNDSAARLFIQKVVTVFGRADVLINNAGRGNCASVEDTSRERLMSIFDLNVFSLWSTTAAVLPLMRQADSGRIINISSMAGKIGYPYNSAYVAAKHAVVGFTASLRAELAGTKIIANVVCPSGVTTEWQETSEDSSIGRLFGDGIRRSRGIARELGIPLTPLKPMMSADDAARCIVDSILRDETNDLYTHSGTEDQAIECATNRSSFEAQMLPLNLGMQAAYHERKDIKDS